MIVSKEQKAVAIGLWRQGNKIETIMWILGIEYVIVDKIIEEYKKTLV